MEPHPFTPTRDRVLSATLLSSAYASAAVALLFLTVDAFRGDPFMTPSLMGSAIFLGLAPSTALPVRLDMVALYSLVHLTAFTILGSAATAAAMRSFALRDRRTALPLLIFGALTVAEIFVDIVLVPGLVNEIGFGWVTLANAAAAWVMGSIIRNTLADEEILSLIDAVVRATNPIS